MNYKMSYIIQEHEVEFSGYVRGKKNVKIYYDAETKEQIDYEALSPDKIVRNDTEISELPSFNAEKKYTKEEE